MKLNSVPMDNIIRRVQYLTQQMIFMANSRRDVQKGDPKVGGHPAACSSSLHIMAAIHLFAKSGYDYVANKPHASPLDHSLNYLLDLFLHKDLSRLSLAEANQAMQGLRAFPQAGEPVFQSYHSHYDPDGYRFLPSGTVGIPAVAAGYLAHAYTFARHNNYKVPEAHFWSVLGDSEFREGSLFEAVPDFAERNIGNLTWVVDYNRQSLDGHRLANPTAFEGGDSGRICNTMRVNGWQVIELRHGPLRQQQFKKHKGLQKWFEQLSDYDLQLLLLTPEAELAQVIKKHKWSAASKLSAKELQAVLHDFGGHDLNSLVQALEKSKTSTRPTCIVAHTIKGWGLKMKAAAGNHSMLAAQSELNELRQQTGLQPNELFARFAKGTPEAKFLHTRGQQLYQDVLDQEKIKNQNKKMFFTRLKHMPSSFDINFKMASYPHTQWMLGQVAAKLTRLAAASDNSPLSSLEQQLQVVAENMVFMAPDVGTSTNLNPTMDGHVFGPAPEAALKSQDPRSPALEPGVSPGHRFLRFDITEANAVTCLGAYGQLFQQLGVPVLPLMTVYDFFVKRALDQYFYTLYWGSKFILVGTPSGVSLSPEGAQHCWKSDFQIPNQITWEPCFCIELDWILCDSIGRLLYNKDQHRSGVLIRGTTRGVQQKDLLKHLRQQKKFKAAGSALLAPQNLTLPGAVPENEVPALGDDEILQHLRADVLRGGYYLIHYQGYANFEPGDNVVQVFAMGALVPEAIEASQQLLHEGIYANVVVVTSSDLLVGHLGHAQNYQHLRQVLGVNDRLHLPAGELTRADLNMVACRRVPVVSVHDGEPGLLDNIGSIVGVPQEALAVRRHSRCGRPQDVYAFHGLDATSIAQACQKALQRA